MHTPRGVCALAIVGEEKADMAMAWGNVAHIMDGIRYSLHGWGGIDKYMEKHIADYINRRHRVGMASSIMRRWVLTI